MSSLTKPKCYSCGAELNLPSGIIGRSETCDYCRSDVKVCKNCLHYDPNTYNECREPSAERVVDKEKRNFCDYFSLSLEDKKATNPQKEDLLKKLDDLFKK